MFLQEFSVKRLTRLVEMSTVAGKYFDLVILHYIIKDKHMCTYTTRTNSNFNKHTHTHAHTHTHPHTHTHTQDGAWLIRSGTMSWGQK